MSEATKAPERTILIAIDGSHHSEKAFNCEFRNTPHHHLINIRRLYSTITIKNKNNFFAK